MSTHMYVVMSLGHTILVAFSSLLSASPPSYYPLLLSRLFKNHMLMVFIMYVCGGVCVAVVLISGGLRTSHRG